MADIDVPCWALAFPESFRRTIAIDPLVFDKPHLRHARKAHGSASDRGYWPIDWRVT